MILLIKQAGEVNLKEAVSFLDKTAVKGRIAQK